MVYYKNKNHISLIMLVLIWCYIISKYKILLDFNLFNPKTPFQIYYKLNHKRANGE